MKLSFHSARGVRGLVGIGLAPNIRVESEEPGALDGFFTNF